MSVAQEIFISYNREDQEVARRFADGFEREGFTVWWDATLRSGEAYDQVTEQALRAAKAVVVLWSTKSVESRWVRAEATEADRNKTLVPVMIEPCKRPIMFELTHTADLSHWQGDGHDKAWQNYVADVRRFVDKGGTIPLANAPPPSIAKHNKKNRLLRLGMTEILLLAVVIAVAAFFIVTRPSRQSAADPAQAATLSKPASPTISLAVLPFVNMSSDKEQEYFSDGLSEELLNQLAQIKDLQVAGRTSSFSFKGKNEDLRVIGEKLGVNHLLEGSVRKDVTQLRITAQLINAATGAHLWSQTYDRKLENIFAVQEEISRDVSQALSITLGVGKTINTQGGTTNVEAYDKYLRARELGFQSGPAEIMKAVALYREVLALDPKFAQAWYGFYLVQQELGFYSPENAASASQGINEAREHLEALAPDSWWTQSIQAAQFTDQSRWAEAEAAYRAALASAPSSDSSALTGYGGSIWMVGQSRKALDYYTRARLADPLSLEVSGILQILLDSVGQPDEAQAEYQRSRDLAGTHERWDWFAMVRHWSRKGVSAADIDAHYRQYVASGEPALPMPIKQIMVGKLEDKAAALAVIRSALNDPAYQDSGRQFSLAFYADHFGDKDTLFTALHRGLVDFKALSSTAILWFPWESSVRSDPRFKQIVRDLKLVDYWRATGNWGDYCHPVGTDDFECK